jgi:hypothetical protein
VNRRPMLNTDVKSLWSFMIWIRSQQSEEMPFGCADEGIVRSERKLGWNAVNCKYFIVRSQTVTLLVEMREAGLAC